MANLPDDDAFSGSLKAHADYHRAPEDLRLAITQSIGSHDTVTRPGRKARLGMRSWGLGLSAAFAVGVLATLAGMLLVVPRVGQDDALVALASDHARALVTGTEIDVISSDRHTVKPWISREMGVSPTVVDLAGSGYPLRGGRRGYLEGIAVPTLVYSYKEHIIDVYALSAAMQSQNLSKARSINGFHCITWSEDGFTMVAISDVDSPRLADFVRLMRSPPAEQKSD
jgi:anti-sigma factor RsiW